MASATTNMNLALVDGSDFISPQPFNQNFQAIDMLGVDYVLDEGHNGDWWYRKWKSGLAECGIQHHACGTLHPTRSWGPNLVYDTAWSIGTYPFTFASVPTVTISADAPANYWPWHTLTPSSSPTSIGPTVYAVEPYEQTINNVYLSCYVVGRWQ